MNDEFLDLAEKYLHELENSDGLRVVLVPPREQTNIGGMIRAAESTNPDWYRRFAGQYMNVRGRGRKRMRRPRTFINRSDTIAALRRILAGKRSGVYAERLTDFIERELARSRPIEYDDADEPLLF